MAILPLSFSFVFFLLFLCTLDGLQFLKEMIFPLCMLLFTIIVKKFIAMPYVDRLFVLSIELVLPKRFVDHGLS